MTAQTTFSEAGAWPRATGPPASARPTPVVTALARNVRRFCGGDMGTPLAWGHGENGDQLRRPLTYTQEPLPSIFQWLVTPANRATLAEAPALRDLSAERGAAESTGRAAL